MTDRPDDPGRLDALAPYDLSAAEIAELDDLRALCELTTRLLGAAGAAITIDDGSARVLATHGAADGEPDAVAPLVAADGTRLGTLSAHGGPATPPAPDELRSLTLLAHQVVGVLELRARTLRADGLALELARSEHQLAMFVRKLSHDLKTPLTAILGFTELVLDVPAVADDAMALTFIQRCRSAGVRMLEMIDRVHAFARIDDSPTIRDVGLAEVLPQVLLDVGEAPDVEITWTDGIVPAEAGQLSLLLTHLIGNAVAYRRPGVPGIVVIEVGDAPGGVLLTVRDNGSGIPANQREEALRPLTRLRGDVAGSGLGLAICARIMRAHGGRIELGDTPGGGTTVTALFPGSSRRIEMKRLVRR